MNKYFQKASISGTFKYVIRLLKAPISRRDFVIVTPPFLKFCIVLDKKRFNFIRLTTFSDLDYWTISQVFFDQDYKIDHLQRYRELQSLLEKRIEAGVESVILDAGANIGASSLYFARNWPESRIWSLEPAVRNIKLAKQNATDETTIIHAGLGREDGECSIVDPDSMPNAFTISPTIAGTVDAIPMICMKTIMEMIEEKGFAPFILKIDIEGAEAAVFEDAADWLRKWPVLMIELHDWMLPGSASSSAVLIAMAETSRDVILNGSTLVSIANPIEL